ncbi:hypothetical protein [Sinomonas halotolerans]|uniref:Uncharacterized protein n=1 Tax=Sinomonas halotolerans TaxID=1644133 RepID=A0ABU9X6D9_9MICC
MTHLDRLDQWLSSRGAELKQVGSLTYTRGPRDLPNPSAHLVVALTDYDVELVLWESGEAEFNYGTLDDPVLEHVEVESPAELDALLERVLAVVVGGTS